MVRISATELVRRDKVQFDVDAVDDALEKMYPNEYTALKDITLFLSLPAASVRWNGYDVDFSNSDGAKRLRRVSKICQRYGVRVQNLVFEALLEPVQLSELKTALAEVIDFDADTIRFYDLGSKWESKISTMGNDKGFKQDETLII